MKYSNQPIRFLRLLAMIVSLGAMSLCLWPVNLQATGPDATQRLFATPDEAVKALKKATEVEDKVALREIFGPEVDGLLTGDLVQDGNNAQRFAAALSQSCNPVKDAEDKITLEVGANNWPMPIPLMKTNGQWYFDTASGREEIVSRHIGKDELHAIGVCRAYVVAQRQYGDANPDINGGPRYAERFKSSWRRKDGLYWPATGHESASPFGPVVAEACGPHQNGGPRPFHGYFFKILTQQGLAAPGGSMNYLHYGNLTRGFALVAYPEHWDQSGIMTFIVNQQGKVYQRNFGTNTSQAADTMKEYNPDDEWSLVPDKGVLNAVLEK